MLGTAAQQRYRRALNLLSRGDYLRSGRRYVRKTISPIV